MTDQTTSRDGPGVANGAGEVAGAKSSGSDGIRTGKDASNTEKHGVESTIAADDGHSVTSRSSKRSTSSTVKLREAEIRKRLAQERKEQLIQEHNLRRKQTELTEKIELLKINNEVSNAELEATMWHEVIDEESERFGPFVPPQNNVNPNERTEQWFADQPQIELNTQRACPPQDQIEQPQVKLNTQRADPPQDQMSSVLNSSMVGMALGLPKPDMQVFSGNPIEYWTFLHCFDTNISERVLDNRMRLSYLIQFTSG